MASNERPATDEPTGPYASTAGAGSSTTSGTNGTNGAGYRAERVSTSGGHGTGTRTQFTGGQDASVGTLIGNLLSDTNRLVRDEIRLAKAEAGQKVSQAKSGAISLAIGGALLLLGAIYLIQAAIYALALIMPGWLAALIVGGLIAIIGLVMLKSGQKKLQADKLTPHRTQENLSRDAHMVKESV